MGFSGADRDLIEVFWTLRASSKQGRWTSDDLFTFEDELIESTFHGLNSLLDLGAGHGSLAKNWASRDVARRATCVDFRPEFSESYKGEARVDFSIANALEFSSTIPFDCAIAFGLVTYLDAEEELRLYENLSNLLVEDGLALVKNAVSTTGREKIFRGYSSFLQSEYVARYPEQAEQSGRLSDFFTSVVAISYPFSARRFDDTVDRIFVCKK